MDIASLQTFIAVAEGSSFSLAAERLFLTQPAVSKRVAALESELDAPLFDRIGRQVHMTEAGRALLPRARAILAEVEDSRRAIANLASEVSGPLTLGSSHHIALHRLPPILRAYHRAHPAVQLELTFMSSESVLAGVERGDLELGLVTLPPITAPPLQFTPIWEDPLAVVCSLDHPLVAENPTQARQLAPWPAILPEPNTHTRNLIDTAMRRGSASVGAVQTSESLETLRVLIEAGLGWGVLPASMVHDRPLTILPVADLVPSRRLGLAQHSARTPSNAARAMAELLLEHAGNVG